MPTLRRAPESFWIFTVSFAFGLGAMAPSVSFGDSGEFIAAAATLSVPHAPGYPLYCLLGRAVATLMPWGPWAYRINLASVLCGSIALALLYSALRRAGANRLSAAVGAGFLGLTPLWLHTTLMTEVFALNSLIAAVLVWLFVRFQDHLFDPRPMAVLGLVLGLGGANHHTLILIVPAILGAGWMATRAEPMRVAKGLAWFLGFGLLGLCVYAYLPIRARALPPLDWGHPVDLPRFLHVLLRRDYGSFSLTIEGGDSIGRFAGLWPQLMRYLKAVWEGFGPAGTLLSILGIATARSGGWKPGQLFPWLLILAAGPGFLWLGNPPFDPQTSGALDRFYLLSWMGVAWFVAQGAETLQQRVQGGAWGVAVLAAAAFSTTVAHAASWHQRWDIAAHDYGENVLRTLEPGAVYWMDGGDDSFYTLAHELYARGRRPDIEPHDRGGLVFQSAYGPDFRRLPPARKEARRQAVERMMARKRPTYYSTLKPHLIEGHAMPLNGLLRRLGTPVKNKKLWEDPAGRALWDVYPMRYSETRAAAHYRYRAIIPVYDIMRAEAELVRGEHARALKRLDLAMLRSADVRWVPGAAAQAARWSGYLSASREAWPESEAAYRRVVSWQPKDHDAWLNIGVTYEKRGRYEDALAAYRKGLALKPDAFQGYYNLGSLFWKQSRWKEAAQAFASASRLRPQDARVRSFYERAKQRSGS